MTSSAPTKTKKTTPGFTPNLEPSQRTKKFRIYAKKLFLTYPQCGEAKEAVLTRISTVFKDALECTIVAREMHQTDEPHLHVLIAFKERRDFKGLSGMKQLDKLAGKHGNYQAVRNWSACVVYVAKENDFISEGIDIPKFIKATLGKRSTKSDKIAKMIIDDNATSEEIAAAHPGFFLMHKRKIEELEEWTGRKRAKLDMKPWIPLNPLNYEHEADQEIAEWLNANMTGTRPFKSPQLFIHGDTNLGKTSLIENLNKHFRVFYIPVTEDFYCTFTNSDYDLAILDEFKGQKTIQWMNRWLDGQRMGLKMKGKAQYLKTLNIPTIILSNYPIEECYPTVFINQPQKLETLLTRFKVVNVFDPIDVLFKEYPVLAVDSDGESVEL